MKKAAAILILLSFVSVVAFADEQAQDLSADQQEELEKVQLARDERKKLAAEKKTRMESCLTLVRAFYGGQEEEVADFIAQHPTTNKQRLMSKLLARMMLKCNGEITSELIPALQDYKATPINFDYTKSAYAPLIAIDWEDLKFKPAGDELMEGEGTDPVEMSNEESMMSVEVEELSDEMARENQEELRA